uniref:Uncharacterized protein n=1 Tax=uncultured Thiotrichaceae bacterium TaxID=298394 RepID=A0A6S6RW39_9GAMM|nr:MAG: Unknown protein [uncultured Thiotrichaceae bacterium]
MRAKELKGYELRQVIIQGTPPQAWIDKTEAASTELCAATTVEERETVIEKYKRLWQDPLLKNWLLQQFNNKCWYTEAQDSVSAYHVDHFRPKGRVTDASGNQSGGYWWLAFEWKNYRISGQLPNIRKKDLFHINGTRLPQLAVDDNDLTLEAPELIDPIGHDTRHITYDIPDDSGDCLAVSVHETLEESQRQYYAIDHGKAQYTIDVLGLNKIPTLKAKRTEFWNMCTAEIQKYENTCTAPHVMQSVLRPGIIKNLRKMVMYEAEFSSISAACINKNAPKPLVDEVFAPLG